MIDLEDMHYERMRMWHEWLNMDLSHMEGLINPIKYVDDGFFMDQKKFVNHIEAGLISWPWRNSIQGSWYQTNELQLSG